MALIYLAIVVSDFVLFSISYGSFNSECLLGGGGGVSYILYPAVLEVLFLLAFLSVSLFLVCFSGVVHMSQPVAG